MPVTSSGTHIAEAHQRRGGGLVGALGLGAGRGSPAYLFTAFTYIYGP
jgi:hypothetical protein